MAHMTGIDTLVRSYHGSLQALAARALESLDQGPETAIGVLRKLVMEVVRHDVYEEASLHPLVRRALPDGDDATRAASAEAVERSRALEALCRRSLDEPAFRDALVSVITTIKDHAERQEPVLDRLGETLDRDVSEDAAAMFTPTQEVGPTHSLPPGLPFDPAGGSWPAPGWPEECRRAFVDEVATRQGVRTVQH